MKVAVLYSGGKDSNYALADAIEKGWEIAYLLSVKPTRTDCYLFHYATVEHTQLQAKQLGIPHIITTCDIADPELEAGIVKNIVEKHPVDAVILGGTGLQVTQIKAVQDALLPLRVETFASHVGEEHGDLIGDMLEKGYKIMISQFAAEGLGEEWLGRVLDKDSYKELKYLSTKHGFHVGGDGSAFDTFVLDCPLFERRIEFGSIKKYKESGFSGYLVAESPKIVEKAIQKSL
ncbi:MAG: diphthine--ammonia ligase [Candidatus Woesearchaeota archaeon]